MRSQSVRSQSMRSQSMRRSGARDYASVSVLRPPA
jgi:hypothetical protein